MVVSGSGADRYGLRLDETGQFESVLQKVDEVIEKRIQSMQIAGMTMASYHFDGPMETVVDAIEPMILAHGFSVAIGQLTRSATGVRVTRGAPDITCNHTTKLNADARNQVNVASVSES